MMKWKRLCSAFKYSFQPASFFITIFSFLCFINIIVIDYKSKVFSNTSIKFLDDLYWSGAIFIIGLLCFLVSLIILYHMDIDAKEVKVRNIDNSYGVNCYIIKAKKIFSEGSYVTIYQRRCNGHGYLPRVYAIGVCVNHPTMQNLLIIQQVSYGKDNSGNVGDRPTIFTTDKRFAKELIAIPYLMRESNVIREV